ncbi:predicted protein [Histoplasma mississippiense (nom. inval.)]|uniref:predicted protein n=1 Tax=Ajellomyces capsulatus (strain NAm1 / WU24) TaxID=2059318 RepID=UPI000157C46E|nr:predicted protein [Histoplasma mississippiense (nom. inval.)]EDN08203.1 predicted protein [Histoplasma mississippiense (nom. inval.)]
MHPLQGLVGGSTILKSKTITTSTWLEQRGRMRSRLLFAGPRNWAQKYVGKPRQEYLVTKVAKRGSWGLAAKQGWKS